MDAVNFFGDPLSNTVTRRCDGATLPNGGASNRHCVVLAMDGDKWKPRQNYKPRKGGSGFGINGGGAMYTLNTVDRHIVAILGGTECHA